MALGNEAVQGQSQLFAQNERLLQNIEAISAIIAVGPVDTARSAFEQHLDLQIDHYRDLMNAGKPRTALALFEMLDGTGA